MMMIKMTTALLLVLMASPLMLLVDAQCYNFPYSPVTVASTLSSSMDVQLGSQAVADDAYATATTPLILYFGCTQASTVYISTNGRVCASAGSAAGVGSCNSDCICPYSQDLVTRFTYGYRTNSQGGRTFVVYWNGTTYPSGNNVGVQFVMTMTEGTSPSVSFGYNILPTSCSATVGFGSTMSSSSSLCSTGSVVAGTTSTFTSAAGSPSGGGSSGGGSSGGGSSGSGSSGSLPSTPGVSSKVVSAYAAVLAVVPPIILLFALCIAVASVKCCNCCRGNNTLVMQQTTVTAPSRPM